MTYNYKDIIKRLCYTLSIPVVHILYFVLNKPNPNAHRISTVLDNFIPFNKWFIIPYVYWYVHIAGLLVIFAIKMQDKQYFKVLGSLIMGELICCAIFYFYPTVITRQTITEGGFLNYIIKLIYAKDYPGNCFPSLHVLNTVIVSYYFFDLSKNKKLRGLVFTLGTFIVLSTMFIKQHYFLDIVGAVAIASFSYLFFKKEMWTVFSKSKNDDDAYLHNTVDIK